MTGAPRAYHAPMRSSLPTVCALAALLTVIPLCGCEGKAPDAATAANAKASGAAVTEVVYEVQGMHCDGCAEAIVAEVSEVPGVASVQCTFESKQARIALRDPAAKAQAEHAITKLGYTIGAPGSAPAATDAPAAPAAPAGQPASK